MKRKSTKTRQAEIVDAAMSIIAKKGAKRFTAQLVASEIGVTAGAIFRHFNNMDEIVDAVIDRMESVLFDDKPPSAIGPLDRLEEFFHKRVQVVASNPDLSRLLLTDHVAQLGGDRPAARVQNLKRRSHRFVRRCLEEALNTGEIPGAVSREAAAVIILGSILAVGHSSTPLRSKTAVKKLSSDVWAAIVTMLQPGRTSSAVRKKGSQK